MLVRIMLRPTLKFVGLLLVTGQAPIRDTTTHLPSQTIHLFSRVFMLESYGVYLFTHFSYIHL